MHSRSGDWEREAKVYPLNSINNKLKTVYKTFVILSMKKVKKG